MKIAILLLCHKRPNQIYRLISSLNCPNIHFYIHIDKKSTMTLKNYDQKKVTIIPQEYRTEVLWGTNSMVKATLLSMRYICEHNSSFDYLWLMSGEDYPITTTDNIIHFFNERKGENFIDVIDENNPFYLRYKKRVSLYYPKWMMKRNKVSKLCKHLYIYITGGWEKTLYLVRKDTKKSKFYYGSQWWTLTKECVCFILKESEQNNSLLSFFDNALVPDESYFQTLIMNSSYANSVEGSINYIHWKNQKNNPNYFGVDDFEFLKSLKKDNLLARKFKEDFPEDVLKQVRED